VATYGSAALTALGDPSRQAIIERLAAGPLAVTELAAQLPISRPAVSQHLKVLAEAGVVGHRAVGTRRVYYLDLAGIAAIRVYLDGFWHQALTSFAALAEDTAPADPPLYPPIPQAPDDESPEPSRPPDDHPASGRPSPDPPDT
jgi:DNA-binding transcriptional ArsR family regulator